MKKMSIIQRELSKRLSIFSMIVRDRVMTDDFVAIENSKKPNKVPFISLVLSENLETIG
jgi:hypothetical protein